LQLKVKTDENLDENSSSEVSVDDKELIKFRKFPHLDQYPGFSAGFFNAATQGIFPHFSSHLWNN